MLLGYAFWGIASVMFNVRESKRLFSIVGAGDIPAKLLGYAAFGVLKGLTDINNLILVAVAPLLIAFLLQRRYCKQGYIQVADHGHGHAHSTHAAHGSLVLRVFKQFFTNRLIFYIALLSLVSYVVFALIDYSFLDVLKAAKDGSEISSFIVRFFIVSRLLATLVKLVFSSRMVTRIGLSNVLLITPLLLLIITFVLLFDNHGQKTQLYILGAMVVLADVLRSTIQEPVYFILFQPLKPHDRLRGHLVAKGYTLPFALLGVGLFLYLYLNHAPSGVPLSFIAQILAVFLALWIVSVFLIKKQYLRTLIATLQKGYFTGAELFLNDSSVTNVLLAKTESHNPVDVIHSLNLLERSGYSSIYTLLLKSLHNALPAVREYVLSRVVANNMTGALPAIEQQLLTETKGSTRQALITAKYFIAKPETGNGVKDLQAMPFAEQKAALLGLLYKNDEHINAGVLIHLAGLVKGSSDDRLLVLDIILENPGAGFTALLQTLLYDTNPAVYKKAIEAVGKVKDFSLIEPLLELAVQHRAYHALQRAILHFGDDVFAGDKWISETLPAPLVASVIKVAGKIKGSHSATFLNKLLAAKNRYADEVVEALWQRKESKTSEGSLLEEWVTQKLEQSSIKVNYLEQIIRYKNLHLLKEAIAEEIHRDVQLLLKAFAMLYDRQQVDRAIELMAMDKQYRMFNAIEVLELTIPAKYFTPLNMLVELVNDIDKNEVITNAANHAIPYSIIEEILQHNKANFSEWTRSVACYMLPRLRQTPDTTVLLSSNCAKEEQLYTETRHYVLSMLK
jgi:hypothetical protein